MDRVSVAPLNGVGEVAGPEQFTLDMLIRSVHGAINEPREVLTDPQARYFGAVLSQRTLVPNGAILGEIRFDGWLRARLISGQVYDPNPNGISPADGVLTTYQATGSEGTSLGSTAIPLIVICQWAMGAAKHNDPRSSGCSRHCAVRRGILAKREQRFEPQEERPNSLRGR
jgi:hypothetical protein